MNQEFENVIRMNILNDEMNSLLRYLDDMNVNKETKEELEQAIKMFRLNVLYDVMLVRFNMMLSEEEKGEYERERKSLWNPIR